MSIPFTDAFSLLRDLFLKGGMEIDTPFDPDSKNRLLAARTIIQPDADIIMYVSKEALNRPDLVCNHFNALEKKIAKIRRLRLFLKSVPNVLWLVSLGFLAKGVFVIGKGEIVMFICGVALSGMAYVIKPVARWGFAKYLRAKSLE